MQIYRRSFSHAEASYHIDTEGEKHFLKNSCRDIYPTLYQKGGHFCVSSHFQNPGIGPSDNMARSLQGSRQSKKNQHNLYANHI